MQNLQVSFTDGTFQLELIVASPPNEECVLIFSPFEQRITLDTANLNPGAYTVIANGVSAGIGIPGGEEPVPEAEG